MRMRPFGSLLNRSLNAKTILSLMAVIALAAADVRAAEDVPATLKGIAVSTDASKVEIAADRELTYTFYKTANPPRAVIDLAQTETGDVPKELEVNTGNIKRVSLTKHTFGGGFLSRVEIALVADDDFTVSVDPKDKGRLLVAFNKPQQQPPPAAEKQPEQPQPVAVAQAAVPPAEVQQVTPAVPAAVPEAPKEEAKPADKPVVAPQGEAAAPVSQVAVAAPAAEPAKVPPAASGQRTLSAIAAVADGIDLQVQGGVESFKSFRMGKPERLVVDILGARSSIKVQAVEVNAFTIAKARIGMTPERVRVVFDSTAERFPQYEIVKSETGLKVAFKPAGTPEKAESAKAATAAPPVAAEAKKATAGKKQAAIEAIDFMVSGDYSQIAVTVSGACVPGKPTKAAKGMSLTFRNCLMPRKLQRFIDTSAFPSVVQGINPLSVKAKTGSDARFTVQLRADAPSSIRQDGDRFIWEIRNTEIPPVKEEKKAAEKASGPAKQLQAADEAMRQELAGESGVEIKVPEKGTTFVHKYLEKKVYSGRRVSLEFSDADVRKIFQLIAEVSNLNFLISDDVAGTISIKLVNVPWDQALDVILEAKGLEMKREGNIVQIKPRGKFKSIEQEEAEAKRAKERMLPLTTEIFEVNFAAVADVERQFASLKSERGTINRDERTNRVIVKDVQSAIDEMRFLLKNIDMPEKQVLIEARIVEASNNFQRDLGIQWALHATDSSANVLNVTKVDAGWGGVIGIPPPSTGFNPTTTPGVGMGLSFGKLGANVQLDMRLSAAASISQIKIVSSPKVITLNNKEAVISQGQALYLPTVSSEGTKQEKVDATLSLQVRPRITPDGSIMMVIVAKNDSPGTPPPGATAAVDKKEARTELLVKNGETTVIGGIFVDRDTEVNSGVPFLMDIPLLGTLFKSTTKVKNKSELLIFITPRIIS